MNKTIIFDLDGTLIESKFAIAKAVNLTLVKYSHPELDSEFIHSTIGRPVTELFECATQNRDELEMLVNEFRTELATNGHKLTSVMPSVREALDALEIRGYQLAVASNKPSSLSKIVLEKLDLVNYFQFIVGPDMAKPKPSSDMLKAVSNELKSNLVAMIGDTKDDAVCALEYGIMSFTYDPHKSAQQNWNGEALSTLFEDYAELPSLISSI